MHADLLKFSSMGIQGGKILWADEGGTMNVNLIPEMSNNLTIAQTALTFIFYTRKHEILF